MLYPFIDQLAIYRVHIYLHGGTVEGLGSLLSLIMFSRCSVPEFKVLSDKELLKIADILQEVFMCVYVCVCVCVCVCAYVCVCMTL